LFLILAGSSANKKGKLVKFLMCDVI